MSKHLTTPERLTTLRAQDEALAREKASRIKAEHWSTLLLPKWTPEMTTPTLRATHRKMWWNGIPPRLRGAVWSKAIGNDLGVTEATYGIALQKAQQEVTRHDDEALEGRYRYIVESTRDVFPDLGVFGEKQPMHQELVDVCLAYSMYRPDIPHSSFDIQHIAALLLLNLPASQAFVTLSNLMNRPLPLSFLVHDQNAIHAAYSTTLHALAKKSPGLAQRLEDLRVEPRDYLFHMLGSLFCGRLDVEFAARVMDVYAIEGDKIIPRTAVAVLGLLEGSCVEGDAASVARILREKGVQGGVTVEAFMAAVFEAGKSGEK
jgi:hypothetical protein